MAIPEHKPSIPSIRLIALINPTKPTKSQWDTHPRADLVEAEKTMQISQIKPSSHNQYQNPQHLSFNFFTRRYLQQIVINTHQKN